MNRLMNRLMFFTSVYVWTGSLKLSDIRGHSQINFRLEKRQLTLVGGWVKRSVDVSSKYRFNTSITQISMKFLLTPFNVFTLSPPKHTIYCKTYCAKLLFFRKSERPGKHPSKNDPYGLYVSLIFVVVEYCLCLRHIANYLCKIINNE